MRKGIIFDMDGTMVDNMMIHHRAWQRKLAELGLDMPLAEVKEKIHGINIEILERLFGDRYSPADRVRISDEKEEAYRNIFFPEMKLIDGLMDFLQEMHQAGIPMAVGTAAPGNNANFVVDSLNIRDYFTGVFHAGDVQNGKPDPEVFEKAAASMGLDSSECLIFEDTVTGAEAAKRANAQAIIITTTHAPSEFAHFNHILMFIDNYVNLDIKSLPVLIES